MKLIRDINTLNSLEKLYVVDASYSRLDMFSQCEAKYFYSYIIQEERMFAPAATVGTALHAVLEQADDFQLDLNKLHVSFEEQIFLLDPDKQIDEALLTAGREMLIDYYDRCKDDRPNIYAKELPFSFIIGPALMRGYIDRVEMLGDTVRCIDFKSGKYEVTAKGAKDDLQLGIYALALKHMFPDKEVYAELHYLRSGARKGHKYTDADLEAIELRVYDLVCKLVGTENFRYTENTSSCRWCDHAKSGVCPRGSYVISR